MTHLDLLHRARTALMWPDSIDKQALIRDLSEVITGAYPKFRLIWCWCGEAAVDGKHCNEHTDMEVGDG